jgi:hypothetical protein
MWHNIFENTWPAIIGAGVVGLIFGLTKQRSPAWILLMVLMVVLVAAGTQAVWELFPQLRHGWIHFVAILGVAAVICTPFSFFMQKFCQKR